MNKIVLFYLHFPDWYNFNTSTTLAKVLQNDNVHERTQKSAHNNNYNN